MRRRFHDAQNFELHDGDGLGDGVRLSADGGAGDAGGGEAEQLLMREGVD
jgi:hypothetical protein